MIRYFEHVIDRTYWLVRMYALVKIYHQRGWL